jgi:hypothetical protein
LNGIHYFDGTHVATHDNALPPRSFMPVYMSRHNSKRDLKLAADRSKHSISFIADLPVFLTVSTIATNQSTNE